MWSALLTCPPPPPPPQQTQAPSRPPPPRCACPAHPQDALRIINRLVALFSEQREFAFYGSSLFFAYDAALGANAQLRSAAA